MFFLAGDVRLKEILFSFLPVLVYMPAVAVPVVECPKSIRVFCDGFKDFFETTSDYQSFVALISGAIFGIANLSMIARYFLFSPSVSSMSRFLGIAGLSEKLNRRHRRRMATLLQKVLRDPNRFQFALDDTLIEHSGKKIWGVYSWYDHGRKCYVNAHKLLVLGLVDRKRNVLIPLAWEILHRDLRDGKTYEKAWEVGLRLLDVAVDAGFPRFVVAADSWFFGAEFCGALLARGIDYVIEIKSNLIVENHGRKTISKALTEFFCKRVRHAISWRNRPKYASQAALKLRSMKKSVKIVAVANRRGLDDEIFAYYACNRLTWDASKIWSYSRGRWTIEVQFRELKQFFALGEAAVRSKQSVETEVSLSMIALTVIRLKQLAVADPSENQYRQPVSAGNIVRDLQMDSVSRSILKLAMNPQRKSVEKLRLRYNKQNLNMKPAEKRKTAFTLQIKMSNAQAA